MKKKILTFMLLLVIAGVVMIAGHEIGRHMHKAEQNTETTEASVDYSLYYTYEDVEKVVSYLADTKAESEALSRLIDPLKKSEVIDVAFVKSVAQTIQVKASIYEEALNGKKDSDYVTKAEFEDFYERIVASSTVKGLLRKDVLVLAISEEDKTSFFDGQDTYNAEFEIDESYEGNVLDVYMKNGKIFKINRLGDTQITLQNVWVESVTDGIIIYDNPVGVLTNNPPFDKQMFNLNNYMHLSNKSPQNTFSNRLDLKNYSRGMGAIGLPGDLSSQSRFVRTAFVKMNSVSGDGELESISQFFHILNSVDQQRGCCDLENNKYEITIYTSCCNATKGIYYYTTYDNHQITAVNMNKENLEGDKLIRYPLIKEEQIKLQN
mgnify:CR=1 FL=1